MVRDIVCFIPLIIIYPAVFGGVEAILYAAPSADFLAMIVAAALAVPFLKSLKSVPFAKKESAVLQPSRKGVIITIAREHGSSGKQIGKEEAGKNIRHTDEARASYYHHISNLTWGIGITMIC